MISSIKRIFCLTKRNTKEILRDPISLVFTLGLPLVMEVVFYYLFHEMTSQFDMKYLAPGIVIFSQAFITLFIGILIANDKNTSFLTRLFVSKTKSYEFIISYALAIIPIILIQSTLFFLIGVIIDPSLLKIEIIWCILLSLITSLFFLGLGILFGTICNERSIGGVSSIIISCQSVLSGMWFPVEGMSGGFIVVMNILPFKNATILLQNSLNGINDIYKDFIIPLIIVLSYTIVVFILSIVMFKKKMKSK